MSLQLIRDNLYARCTVISGQNGFLFFGRIIEFDEATHAVTVICENEEYALWRDIRPKSEVKILTTPMPGRNALIVIEGTVQRATIDSLIVTPDYVFSKVDARENFRQNVLYPATINWVNHREVEQPCTIMDISGTGIAIRSTFSYQVGDWLSIHDQPFRADGPHHTISFQVSRVSPCPDMEDASIYGCHFVNLSAEEDSKLYRDIFALQASALHQKRFR